MEQNSKYTEIIEIHNTFAAAIKKFELAFSPELFTPSNNEIRYALRDLIDALDHEQDKKKQEQALQSCKRALIRGYHDLLDAITSKIKLELDDFKDEFGLRTLSQAVPKYFDYVELTDNISDKIASTREKREEREEIYEEIMNIPMDTIIKMRRTIKKSIVYAEELKKEKEEKANEREERANEREERANKKAKTGTIITVAGIIIAVAGIIIGILV